MARAVNTEPYAAIEHEPLTDEELSAGLALLEAAQAQAHRDLLDALKAATVSELIEFRCKAVANGNRAAVARLDLEIESKRTERIQLEHWSKPRPGMRPTRRKR